MPTQKDPTTFGYQNFYSTTLTGDITAGTLTIGLATVPTPTSGILIIEPDSTTAREVVFYTSKGASTVTCPSDGRGWSGSTASAHLTGSAVIMASVDEYFEGIADGTLSTDPIRSTLFQNHVISGGVVAQSAGLVGTFSNIIFYLNGQRYSGTSIANKTYTASKDTYVDVTAASGGAVSVTYKEVANGATAPALSANYLRIAKVVTNGSAITSVTQSGHSDRIGNTFRNLGAVAGQNVSVAYKARVARTSSQSIPNTTWTKVQLNSETYDTGNNFDSTTNYRFTAPVAGSYFVKGRTTYGGALFASLAAIYVNGVSYEVVASDNRSYTDNMAQVTDVIELNAGDYVELYTWQNYGSAAAMTSAMLNVVLLSV